MRFESKEDIEAPIEFVFGELSDFNAFERSALRRGAEVQRVVDKPEPAIGLTWDVSFKLRGKARELKMVLTEYSPPNSMVLSSLSPNMGGDMTIDLVAMSRGRTRMSMDIVLEPKNLSSRLLVQSLKLARGNLSKRFNSIVAGFAKELESTFKKRA